MLKNVDKLLSLALIILCFSCISYNDKEISSSNDKSINKTKLHEICSIKFNSRYQMQFNLDSSYILCYEEIMESEIQSFPMIHFVIISSEIKDIFYEDKIDSGVIEWSDKYIVALKTIPRQIKINDDTTAIKYLNVKKLEKEFNQRK